MSNNSDENAFIRSIVLGIVGFATIIAVSGYGCNKDDDKTKAICAQAEATKVQSANELEKAKVETEKARLELERALIESTNKAIKE